MAWLTRDQVLSALAAGQTVSYGCGCLGVPYRTFSPGDDALVPSQDQIASDEATCNVYGAGGGNELTTADVTSIATTVAQQAITAPIPVSLMTADYSALIDDQRVAHDSPGDHTLTPQAAANVQFRRFVFSNGMGGGQLTLAGNFISPVTGGTAMVTNPTLVPGASVDVISRFVANVGSVAAPAGLRMDGQPAPAGTVGDWVYDIVARNFGGPSAADYANLKESVMSYGQPTSQQVNAASATATKTAAYTMTNSDSIVPADTTGGAFSVTLPPAATNKQPATLYWAAGSASPSFIANTGQTIAQGSPLPVSNVGGVGSSLILYFDLASSKWYAE